MTPDEPLSPEPVATGDRRGDVHLEPAREGGVKAEFTRRPDQPPPPDEQTGRTDAGLGAEKGSPVQDLHVAPASPSAWDARPAEDSGAPPKD